MTISDLPGLGMLASHMVHGKFSCPPCCANVWMKQLKNVHKSCFMGHRKYIDLDHPYRFDANSFDGTIELGTGPTTYYDCPILDKIIALGSFKDSKTYKSVSSLFTLPYWDDNILRYNLDVMHIEKNVFDNCYGTIFNLEGKTKDNPQARRDLIEMNIREELHPQQKPSGKLYLPPARFAMSKSKRRAFCEVIQNVKFPDGYCRNISKFVNVAEGRIGGLKMHDCHVLMQQVMPIALRGILDEDITSMDTTSPIRWSWSSTCFQTAGKHLIATVVTSSYGFQFGSSTTPWKDHQVYFETNPASCGYFIRVSHNH
jgi:hypothetical protein